MLLAAFGALASAMAEVNYQPAVPQAVLPDGTPFLSWSDLTRYTRTYHVSQNNPFDEDRLLLSWKSASPLLHTAPLRTANWISSGSSGRRVEISPGRS